MITPYKDIELKPGTYKLTRDVQNPMPDRRMKYDWTKLPVWNKGLVVYLEMYRLSDELQVLAMRTKAYGHQLYPRMIEFQAIAPYLERIGDDTEPMTDRTRIEILTAALETAAEVLKQHVGGSAYKQAVQALAKAKEKK